MKIVVIGDADTIAGFKLAGVTEAYEVSEESPRESAKRAVRMLLNRRDVALVIITEKAAELAREEIEMFRERMYPIFIEIPDRGGPRLPAERKYKEMIKRAVGIEVG